MKDKSTLKIHGGEGGKCKQPISKLPKQSIKQKNKKGTDKRKMTVEKVESVNNPSINYPSNQSSKKIKKAQIKEK